MKFEKIQNKGQAQIFRYKYLEYLTKTHPLVIWGMYIPVIVLLLYYSGTTLEFSGLKIILLFLAGVVFWTFFEYMMHRFVFHWISDNPRIQRIAYIMHGNHHEFPRDKQRLFMPPVPSLIFASFIFLLMNAAMGYHSMCFFPGFLLGYLLYGSMHYAIHTWTPKQKWLKSIWRNHHLHHYKNEHMGFGVSSNLWDLVFETQFDFNKEKENREAVANLMHHKEEIH